MKIAQPELSLSNGARSGLVGFAGGLARQTAARNVTINNLLPGKMDTERLASGHRARAVASGDDVDVVIARDIASIPARRFGTADEFGRICAFLCSVHAGYITGQNILIDGGLFPAAF